MTRLHTKEQQPNRIELLKLSGFIRRFDVKGKGRSSTSRRRIKVSDTYPTRA